MVNNLSKNITVYADLIKYKLSLAVVLSSVTGYYLYSNIINHHLLFLAAGIFLLSSGSAVLNQYTERKTDSIMERTKDRPIPSKKISEITALRISITLLLAGSCILYFNGITSFLLAVFNVILYNLIYTYLKKKSVLSIIPGALVGAIPPVIGFSSAGGSIFHHNIVLFASFMFLWQLPHFWLIIIKYGKEYSSAGFATISKYLSEIQIRYLIFFWVVFSTGFLFLFCVRTHVIDHNMFLIFTFLNLFFIYLFYRLLFLKRDSGEIKGAFVLINSFSFLIMFLVIAISIFKGI